MFMGDQPATKKDLQSLQTQIEALRDGLRVLRETVDKNQSSTIRMVLEGDKVAEGKVEPVRKALEALTKRVANLE
jgi:polyhydroxyalkanoate synthesis regulator phasin